MSKINKDNKAGFDMVAAWVAQETGVDYEDCKIVVKFVIENANKISSVGNNNKKGFGGFRK
jgi:Fe-S cluster assembly iron-binding protein IscA